MLAVLAARTARLTPRARAARQARLALLDAPGGLLPLLSAAELQLAASPPPGAEALLHASVARLASSSAQGGEGGGGGGGALLSPSAKGQAFVLRHYHAPIKYECAQLLLGVRRLGLGLGLANPHPNPNPSPSPGPNPDPNPSPNPNPNPNQVIRLGGTNTAESLPRARRPQPLP